MGEWWSGPALQLQDLDDCSHQSIPSTSNILGLWSRTVTRNTPASPLWCERLVASYSKQLIAVVAANCDTTTKVLWFIRQVWTYFSLNKWKCNLKPHFFTWFDDLNNEIIRIHSTARDTMSYSVSFSWNMKSVNQIFTIKTKVPVNQSPGTMGGSATFSKQYFWLCSF